MLASIARSIRIKLALVVLATILVALLVAGAALVINDLRAYREAGTADLLTQAEILGRASAPALMFDDPKAAREYLMLLRVKPEISAAVIYNARGRPFATYARDGAAQAAPRLPESDGFRIEGSQFILFKRIEEGNEILGTVYLRSDYRWLPRLARYLGIFAAVAALSLAAALLVWMWLQGALTRPILSIAAVARSVVERRDFSLRAVRTTDDEIGSLVQSFNDMLAEIGRGAAELEATNRSLEREMAERRLADEERARLNAELEQRVAERTAQLEAANRELEGFSYSVSHDLRAPLRAIMGFSRLLVEDHREALDAEAQRKLGVIQGEAARMGLLIDELLAFSRLGRKSMQFADVDMTELARTTFAALANEHDGARPQFRLAALPRAKGDRVLLGQVWANLLANALKFSSKRTEPHIEVSAVSDEREHVYFVRDNGAGFDPRYRAKLFGVFQRLHSSSEFPGTGVGLALVERIVARHGGRVWADGRPDEGATFYFALPKGEMHERI